MLDYNYVKVIQACHYKRFEKERNSKNHYESSEYSSAPMTGKVGITRMFLNWPDKHKHSVLYQN